MISCLIVLYAMFPFDVSIKDQPEGWKSLYEKLANVRFDVRDPSPGVSRAKKLILENKSDLESLIRYKKYRRNLVANLYSSIHPEHRLRQSIKKIWVQVGKEIEIAEAAAGGGEAEILEFLTHKAFYLSGVDHWGRGRFLIDKSLSSQQFMLEDTIDYIFPKPWPRFLKNARWSDLPRITSRVKSIRKDRVRVGCMTNVDPKAEYNQKTLTIKYDLVSRKTCFPRFKFNRGISASRDSTLFYPKYEVWAKIRKNTLNLRSKLTRIEAKPFVPEEGFPVIERACHTISVFEHPELEDNHLDTSKRFTPQEPIEVMWRGPSDMGQHLSIYQAYVKTPGALTVIRSGVQLGEVKLIQGWQHFQLPFGAESVRFIPKSDIEIAELYPLCSP